jgi:DNA-binding NarL/FixJ family response regulator
MDGPHRGGGDRAQRPRGRRARRRAKPGVILMDISMPVMDGIEALDELRKHGNEVEVLMLTGSNARTDIDRARKAGAAGYVTKDRIAAELIDAIVEVAGR